MSERKGQVFGLLAKAWDIDEAFKILEKAPRKPKMLDITKSINWVHTDPKYVATIDLDKAEPIIVGTIMAEGREYWLPLDGWHRIRRAKDLGRKKLPAYILTKKETDKIEITRRQLGSDPSMGAVFPTEGGSTYQVQSEAPFIKNNFPLLRAAIIELYSRILRGELRDQPWYFQARVSGYVSTCIPAFGLLGREGLRDVVYLYGWCFDKYGRISRGSKGMVATPWHVKTVYMDVFDRSMVALDYLADSKLWGPWSEDFDPMVVSSLWWIYEEEAS